LELAQELDHEKNVLPDPKMELAHEKIFLKTG
jgi:hypothetical protein